MSDKYRMFISLLLLIVVTGCSQENAVSEYKPSEEGKAWVARVGEREITASELSQLLAFYHARPGQVTEEDIESALQQLISEEMMAQEAIRMGFSEHPDYLIRQRRMLMNTYLTESKRERYRNINVTEFDVKAFYDENLSRYQSPDMVRTAVIRLSSKDRKAAEVLKAKVSETVGASEGFGKWSSSTDLVRSRDKGGLQSWNAVSVSPRDLPEAIWKEVTEYNVGDVYGPFDADAHTYLVRIVGFRDGEVRTLEEVYRDIKQELIDKEASEIDSEYKSSLKKEYEVAVNRNALPDIQPATSDAVPPGFPF